MARLAQLAAALASLATVSQAFLIPPTTSLAAVETSNEHAGIAGLVDLFHHTDELHAAVPCPGCPIVSDAVDQAVRDDPKTRTFLQINATFSRNEAGDALLLNGEQAYPFTRSSAIFQGKFHADQMVQAPASNPVLAGNVDLGYAITIHHPNRKGGDASNPLDVVEVRLQVIDMDGFQIRELPAMEVVLLETPAHGLMLQNVNIAPSTQTDPRKCHTMLCAWKAWKQSLKDNLAKARKGGCHGKHGKRPHHGVYATEGGRRPHHGFHHNHHHHDGLHRFFRAAVIRVFIPIMIGLFIGATASVVGIIVGHMAIFVWRVLFRRGQRSTYTRVEAEDDDSDDEDDQAKGLVLNQEAPPVYEEAPVYSEKASE